jgi:hypothetical protein
MTNRAFDGTTGTYIDYTPAQQVEWDTRQQDLIDRSKDIKLEAIKVERLRKLEETDWWVSRGNMNEAQINYRQGLRDIPQTYTTEAEYDLLLEVEGEFPNPIRKHIIWSKP